MFVLTPDSFSPELCLYDPGFWGTEIGISVDVLLTGTNDALTGTGDALTSTYDPLTNTYDPLTGTYDSLNSSVSRQMAPCKSVAATLTMVTL